MRGSAETGVIHRSVFYVLVYNVLAPLGHCVDFDFFIIIKTYSEQEEVNDVEVIGREGS